MTEDVASYEAFVQRSYAELLGFALAVTCGRRFDAEDLTHEALIRVGAAWGRIQRRDDPLRYARTVVVRLDISRWRSRRREVLTGRVDVDREPDREPTEGRDDLECAFAALPARQRITLALTYLYDLDDHRIAEIMKCSAATVRSQRMRGLDKLRAALAQPSVHPRGTL